MSLLQVTGLVKEYSEPQWFALRVPTDFGASRVAKIFLLCILFFFGSAVVIPAHASPSGDNASQGEHLFQTRNFDAAFEKFKAVQTDPYASPADLSLSRCRTGIIYSIRDDQKQARSFLELSLSSNSLSESVSPLCFYALLQIYVLDKSYSDARSLMQRFPNPLFPAQYKSRVYALGIEVGRQLKDLEFELSQLDKLSRLMERSQIDFVDLKILGDWKMTQEQVRQRLGEARKAAVPATPVPTSAPVVAETKEPSSAISEETPKPAENSSSVKDPSLWNSSAGKPEGESRDALSPLRAFREGRIDAAARDLSELISSKAGLAQWSAQIPYDLMRERADSLSKDDPRHMRMGVILPRGAGMFVRLQLRALKGIAAFLNSRAARGVDYQVFVKTVPNDSGASEKAAVELILKDKVHAIIGPFHGAQVVGAASAASFFGVPIYALGPVTSSQEYDSAFVVRMGTLAQSQARAQVQLLKRQNRKTVAVLSPADGYGVEMVKAFEAACKVEGLQVQRVEYVDEFLEIFQEPVKSLLGPQDGKNRGPEYWKLVADARKKAAQEKRKFDPTSIKAPAFVPFNALFVPDSLDRVRLIANTFAFFDARTIRFLGDRTWQEAGGRQSVADQFLNGARVPVPKSGAFLAYLRRELSAGESVLDIERQAFDSLLLARTAQYKSAGNNPARIAAALQDKDFSADGASKYGAVDESGEPMIQFEISQYHNGIVLSPNSVSAEESNPEESGE
jgi:hypothetical protein